MLLLAVWIGLLAGFLDLGLMVVNRRWIHRDFFRLGGDFAWIIPAAVAILVLIPGTLIALFAAARKQGVRLGLAVWLLSFVGFIDICARLPLEPWATLLVCGGLATQAARVISGRRLPFLRLVRRTVPIVAGILVVIIVATKGGRAGRSIALYQTCRPRPRAPPTCS